MFYEGRGWESCTGFYVESVGRVIRSKQVLSWSLGWQKGLCSRVMICYETATSRLSHSCYATDIGS